MKFSKLVSLVVTGLLLAPTLKAAEPPAFIQFVRPLGMGGAFTAVADDDNIFGFNPAGLVQRTGSELTILQISPGASTDLKKAYDFIRNNQDDLTNLDSPTMSNERKAQLINEVRSTVSKLRPRVYVAADIASYLSGPRFLGLPAHVGFGAFGLVDASFHMDPGVLIPNISYYVHNDIIAPLAVAHRWNAPWGPGKIGFGLTGKYIIRNTIDQQNISVTQLDNLKSPPLAQGHGVGADLGMLYQPTHRLNVGAMVSDVGGTKLNYKKVDAKDGFDALPERTAVIHSQTNIGVAVIPQKLLWLIPSGERWTFSMDVRDVFSSEDHVFFQNGFNRMLGENLYTHLHMGAEFRYWFFRFRGGAYQGYPSAGLGIDIPFLKLDYAFYSRELGVHAGDKREDNHVVSIALRFGSGHTESRERIAMAKKEAKKKKAEDKAAKAAAQQETPAAAAPASQEAVKPEDTTANMAPAAAPASQEAVKPETNNATVSESVPSTKEDAVAPAANSQPADTNVKTEEATSSVKPQEPAKSQLAMKKTKKAKGKSKGKRKVKTTPAPTEQPAQ